MCSDFGGLLDNLFFSPAFAVFEKKKWKFFLFCLNDFGGFVCVVYY